MKVGDEVVCVRPYGGFKQSHFRFWSSRGVTFPDVGTTYTIREVFEGYGRIFVFVKEITNPVVKWRNEWREAAFFMEAFRPTVKDQKTSQWTAGADPDSEKWDNRRPLPLWRKKIKEPSHSGMYSRLTRSSERSTFTRNASRPGYGSRRGASARLSSRY